MRRHVLIISPRFPPINAADHHRVRLSLPYFEQWGWRATVLAVSPKYVNGVYDPLLSTTIPSTTEVITIPALPSQFTRIIGLNTLAWRCLPYLARIGTQFLKNENVDLIYFSTTAFSTLSLAASWHQKFNVPYVIDFQDPWLSNYYQNSSIKPPGGWLKYGLNQLFASWQEPKALQYVDHVISVSPEYPKILQKRYPWLHKKQFTVLPFGAPQLDFKLLSSLPIQQSIVNFQDGYRHWVYVGAVGPIMEKALRILFLGICQAMKINPTPWNSIKLHFLGTSYASPNRAQKTVEPLAHHFGLSNIVDEIPQRLPYFEALQVLCNSDAIMLIGSDDPGYTASKIYPCILARKPILAIFHEQSSVIKILQKININSIVTFSKDTNPINMVDVIVSKINWLINLPNNHQPEVDWEAFRPYTAKEMARKQCDIFYSCIQKT